MWKPYWICRRKRRSATCIICLAVTYIIGFNMFAFVILTNTSSNHSASIVEKHGSRYMGVIDVKFICKKPEFSPVPLPLTALASFPGSGNTWVRHLLQQSTGMITGSVYTDKSLKTRGFQGEGIRNGSALVIKTHEWGMKERMRYRRAVLLIRNPYDALVAEFNRRFGGHNGYATKQHFRKEWKNYVTEMSDDWVKMNYDWIQFSGALYISRYEEFRKNPKVELTSLLNFLNVSISFKEMLCVMKNIDGFHKRFKMKTIRHDPFSFRMRSKIDGDIDFIDSEIINARKLRPRSVFPPIS